MAARLDAAHSILRRTGVPDGWREASVGDLTSIVGGGTPDREQSAYWRNGTVPWITPTDLTANGAKYISSGSESISDLGLQESNATLVPKNSIVFSTRGTVGSMALAAAPLTCNQSCEILVPRAGTVDAHFLYYLLNYGLSAFTRLSGGTTFGSITRRDIARVRFAVPAQVDEQAAIARILGAVDTALESTRAAVERARQVKRAVLNRFFYDALGETAYADRPRKKLPTGWSLIATERLLAEEPKNGVSPEASSQPPGTPTFSIAAIRDGRVDLVTQSNLKYTRVSDAVARRFGIHRGDILIVRGNANPDLVGKAGMVSVFPEGCIYPDIAKRIVLRTGTEPVVSPEFAVVAWNHAIVHNQVLRRAKTSNGTLKINNRDVTQIVMPVPAQHEQAQLVQALAAIDDCSDALGAVGTAQAQLKRALVHDLLTGRVRVRGELKAPAS